jgi:peroxiredoxin
MNNCFVDGGRNPMKQTDRTRIRPGDVVTPRTLTTFDGNVVAMPEPGRLVHLQFRRFAGCPVCKLHLRAIAARIAELDAAGVREIAVFHSRADALRRHGIDLPFPVIADPGETLYREFGVRRSLRAVLDPRAWAAIASGLSEFGPGKEADESPLGLPADFLIAPDGRVVACKYGKHADDHLSADELLALATATQRAGTLA